MPQKTKPQLSSLRVVIDRMSSELSDVIAAEVERRVAEALSSLRAEMKSMSVSPRTGKADQRRGGRLCPVPGCGNPGAGPRNRWFCKEHAGKYSLAEMRNILERSKKGADAKQPTKVSSDRVVRLPPKKVKARRTLDMICRVDGCGNRSRGPRAGFICDMHRAQLSPEEQLAAREAYKARLTSRPETPTRASLPPAPVPPIVRKAESNVESA